MSHTTDDKPVTVNSGELERVARALFALDAPNGDPDELVFHPIAELQTKKWELYKSRAKAALEASDNAALRKQIEEKDAVLQAMAESKITPGSRYNERLAREYERVVAIARAALAPPSAEQMIDG